ncbi:hypothetical protein B0H34DRAFT_645324 [Crassisporium funariophilum]|nr:hypothetical protein B0H34DRAFT_645324 [Crassisporium funariophilum]
MPSFSNAQSANAAYNPSYVPVIVITGATAGIGQAMAESFARHMRGRVHIILVGRNRVAAEAIIDTFPISEESTYEFIQCDITRMRNIHEMAKDLNSRLHKVNYLVHSAGVSGLRGRNETEEGIDTKLAVRYYARWALTHDLLPLLRKAKHVGEPASVVAILGAGVGPEVDLDDLGLKKHYSGIKAMWQSSAYNDLMVAEFARREPDMAFTHISPGAVDTGLPGVTNPIVRFIAFIFYPLIWLTFMTKETSAEHMLFALLYAHDGLNRRNRKGDDIGLKRFPSAKDGQKLMWQHSFEATISDLQ